MSSSLHSPLTCHRGTSCTATILSDRTRMEDSDLRLSAPPTRSQPAREAARALGRRPRTTRPEPLCLCRPVYPSAINLSVRKDRDQAMFVSMRRHRPSRRNVRTADATVWLRTRANTTFVPRMSRCAIGALGNARGSAPSTRNVGDMLRYRAIRWGAARPGGPRHIPSQNMMSPSTSSVCVRARAVRGGR